MQRKTMKVSVGEIGLIAVPLNVGQFDFSVWSALPYNDIFFPCLVFQISISVPTLDFPYVCLLILTKIYSFLFYYIVAVRGFSR